MTGAILEEGCLSPKVEARHPEKPKRTGKLQEQVEDPLLAPRLEVRPTYGPLLEHPSSSARPGAWVSTLTDVSGLVFISVD